jgi:hypothetical protein
MLGLSFDLIYDYELLILILTLTLATYKLKIIIIIIIYKQNTKTKSSHGTYSLYSALSSQQQIRVRADKIVKARS